MTPLIDAHAHVWRRARTPQPWIDPETMGEIDQDFWSDDLTAAERRQGAAGAVLVQSANSLAETRDLLTLVDGPGVLGVVGWIDLEGDVARQLDELRAAPGGHGLVGIRHLAHQDPDPRWLARAAVGHGLDALAAAGLPFDLVIETDQLPVAITTVRAHPEVSFVLDHLAKPPIAAGRLGDWTNGLARLAAAPNVSAKLSGLTIAASWDSWTVDDLRPVVETAVEMFGPERTMFGSDWPLVRLCGGYASWLAAARDLLTELSPTDRDRVFAGTATRVYRLRADA